MAKVTSFDDYLEEKLKDPEFAEEYTKASKEEPRQWWINNLGADDAIDGPIAESYDNIHVIEYSAYESLVESLVLAKKQRDGFNIQADLLAEALDKIGDMECPYGEGGCDSNKKRNRAWVALAQYREWSSSK